MTKCSPSQARRTFYDGHCITNQYRVYVDDGRIYIRLFTDWDIEIPADTVEDIIQALGQARPIREAQRAEKYRMRSQRTQETYITIRERPTIGVVIGWGTIYLWIDRILIEFDDKGIDEFVPLLTSPPTTDALYRPALLSRRYNRWGRYHARKG